MRLIDADALKNDLEQMLGQETLGSTVSDYGVGIGLAIKAVDDAKTLGDTQKLNGDLYAQMNQIITARDKWKRRAEAAERDINHCCSTCRYYFVFFNGSTPDHDCTNPDGGCSNNYDRWEWRGPREGNGGINNA